MRCFHSSRRLLYEKNVLTFEIIQLLKSSESERLTLSAAREIWTEIDNVPMVPFDHILKYTKVKQHKRKSLICCFPYLENNPQAFSVLND